MLDPSTWLPFAKQLERGQKAKHQHNCGDGFKLLVENKDKGYAAYCYRCSDSGWHPHPKPSFAERLAALRVVEAEEAAIAADPRPPMPALFSPDDWDDPRAKVWLYKAGLHKDFITGLGFYYCPRIKRVVLPVLNDQDKLIYWQARGFDPDRPKYLNPVLDKPMYKAPAVMGEPDRTVVCVTEDILSAARVGQVVEGLSILGTALPAGLEAFVRGRKVAVWLDGDEAGVKGRRKIVPTLRGLGVDAWGVRSERDPKEYPNDEIRAFLQRPRV